MDLAEALVTGELECDCPLVSEDIERVRRGELSFEQFRNKIREVI
jgi:hypothetical protein